MTCLIKNDWIWVDLYSLIHMYWHDSNPTREIKIEIFLHIMQTHELNNKLAG
jgi:hypothetical protein